jgi:hypothetical protein
MALATAILKNFLRASQLYLFHEEGTDWELCETEHWHYKLNLQSKNFNTYTLKLNQLQLAYFVHICYRLYGWSSIPEISTGSSVSSPSPNRLLRAPSFPFKVVYSGIMAEVQSL